MQLILNIGLDGVPADLSYTNGKLNPLVARQALTAVQALRNQSSNMQLILNIGLDGVPADLSYTNGKLNPLVARQALTAVQALRNQGFEVKHAVKHLSDTEPTLVVTAEFGNSPSHGLGNGVNATFGQAVYQAAKALNQDCIAAYSPFTGLGRLIGPKAEAWGEFNPAMFIMPDGTRLSGQPQEA